MALTTVGDLLDYSRQQLNSEVVGVDDTNALWRDNELIAYINEAQQEFSRYTKCLADSTSFTLSIAATNSSYTYDEDILAVTGGWLVGAGKRLFAMSFENFEKAWAVTQDRGVRVGGWETETGVPSFLIQGLDEGSLHVWPVPTADDTANLYVRRVSEDVTATTDALTIPTQFRRGLNLRVMALAYLKHDALETEDLQKSMLMGQKWQSFLQDANDSINGRRGDIA